MYQFEHIGFLLTLALVPVVLLLVILLLRWKKKARLRIGDAKLVNQLMRGSSPRLFISRFVLIIFAFVLCAFASANLRKQSSIGQVTRKGIDVVIALDVSKSMLAEDIKPNRLERAKQVVGKIIDKLGDNRIGLVIFAGRAYLQMPVTTDHSAARLYLSGISPDDVPTQGTNISQALKATYASFNTKEKKYRAVVLITDGEDHDDEALTVVKQMSSEGIMINTIGIGSPEGTTLPDQETGREKLDENGNAIISKLNEQELNDIAKAGGGIYQLYSSSDEVANNLRIKLASIGERTIVDASSASYENYFMFFLAAALLFLVIELFISGIFTARKKAVLGSFILLSVLSKQTTAQEINKQIIVGNDAYKKQSYTEAIKAYGNALNKSAGNEIATYNLGNAYYKEGKNDEAIKSYESLIGNTKNSELLSKAWYNKAVAHHKAKQSAEAIDAYKRTLKLKPSDEHARQNLQRLLQEMKQQQKEDKKDKKLDKKEDEKKKEEEKKKKENEEQPKPQPSKLNKQDADEKLKALLQHEKDLQDKLRRGKPVGGERPKKDW